MIVEHDMCFNKDAVVDVGEVVFEEKIESTNLLNPTGPEKAPTSVPKTDVIDAPETTETMPISAHITLPLIPTKPRRNSLTGLPQYNPQEYGCGKLRSTTKKDRTALIVEGHDQLEVSGIKCDDPAEANLLCEAVYKALSAITKDQPPIKSVINRSESDQWKQAIKEELDQIEKLGTWELVEAPDNANVTLCCWVLRRKCDAQGWISQYKACLITKGFCQQFSIDYTDTFAPTVCPATLRILLALGAANRDNIIIKQANIKNAYLNSWMHHDEVVLMDIPKFYKLFRQLLKEGK